MKRGSIFDSNAVARDLTGLRTCFAAGAAAMVMLIAGCGGGGGGDGGGGAAPLTVSGKLSAPGGVLAFNAPTGLKRFFAEIFGRNAFAALPGVPPVAGAAVKLIEIDSAGSQVGPDIATASSAADGSFALSVPAGFVPGPRYVVRATGAVALDRLVTDLTSQDVDPGSHAAKSLVLTQLQSAGGNIQNLQRLQVDEIASGVAALINDINPAGLTSIPLANALQTAAQNDPVVTSQIGNLTAPDSIAGTVTDANGASLPGIRIEVRSYVGFNLRASSMTDASGQYSMNLAQGDYVVGAMNFTQVSMAASEWWTCNDVQAGPICGETILFRAPRLIVGAGATTLNFKLEPGARFEGTINVGPTPVSPPTLPGVQAVVRDFTLGSSSVFRNSGPTGIYRVHVRPGTYLVGVRNRTVQPYASGWYNGPALPLLGGNATATGGGGATTSDATPVTVAAGYTYSIHFPLIEGGLLRGLVTDGAAPTPNPVAGATVRLSLQAPNDTVGAFFHLTSADSMGNYRMWVRPGTYSVRTRGQLAQPTVVAFSTNNNPPAVNFGAQVGRATAILRGPGNAPLPLVAVSVIDSTGAVFQGGEFTRRDGAVEVYAQPTGNYRIEYRVDNGSTAVGSAIHDGTPNPTQMQLLLGALVPFDTAAAAPTALGTITLPAGGELRGVVTIAGVPTRNLVVQVRSGGVIGANRFLVTRTRNDGSYSLSLPAGTYDRVCAFVLGTAACPAGTPVLANEYASADNVAVTANQSNTLNIAIP